MTPDRRQSSGEVLYRSTAAWTNATTSATTITGLSFVPDPGGVYRIEYSISAYASVATEGLTVSIDDGNAVVGSADMRVRGASATTAVIYSGPTSAALTVGTNSPATPGDRFTASGVCVITAHATAPTAFSIQGAAETGGGNSVSVGAGEAMMLVRRIA